MKKKPFLILLPLLVMALFYSFATSNLYPVLNLTREELTQRLAEELVSETPRTYFFVENAYYTYGIYLNTSLDDFNNIATGKYNSLMKEAKSEIMDILKSPEFIREWRRKLYENGYYYGNNRIQMAQNRALMYLEEQYTEIPETGLEDYITSQITETQNYLSQIITKRSSPFTPNYEIAELNNNAFICNHKLLLLKYLYERRTQGDDSMKAACKTLMHFNSVALDMSTLNNQILETIAGGQNRIQPSSMDPQKSRLILQLNKLENIMSRLNTSIHTFDNAFWEYKTQFVLNNELSQYQDTEIVQMAEKSSPYLRLAKILESFMESTKDIDFTAKLNEDKIFVVNEYEFKDHTWKFFYRRGEKFTASARKVAKMWLKQLPKPTVVQ